MPQSYEEYTGALGSATGILIMQIITKLLQKSGPQAWPCSNKSKIIAEMLFWWKRSSCRTCLFKGLLSRNGTALFALHLIGRVLNAWKVSPREGLVDSSSTFGLWLCHISDRIKSSTSQKQQGLGWTVWESIKNTQGWLVLMGTGIWRTMEKFSDRVPKCKFMKSSRWPK